MDNLGATLGNGNMQQTTAATQAQLQQMDASAADIIYLQMEQEQNKMQLRQWQMNADSQNKKLEITQDVTASQAKSSDSMFKKWDDFIKS